MLLNKVVAVEAVQPLSKRGMCILEHIVRPQRKAMNSWHHHAHDCMLSFFGNIPIEQNLVVAAKYATVAVRVAAEWL